MRMLLYLLVFIELPHVFTAQYCDNLCGFGTQCVWDVITQAYACLCRTGYLNHQWDQITNRHVCQGCEWTVCDQGTACSWESSVRVCKCRPGFDHLHQDANTHTLFCNDIDECSPGFITQCHGGTLCENTIGSYNCTCKSGYSGITIDEEKYTCPDIDECRNPEEHHCGKGTRCVNSPGSHLCECLPGYSPTGGDTGIYQCSDIDECTTGLSSCGENSGCTNIPGSHECRCFRGFGRKAGDENCTDIDECFGNDRCNSSSICVNTIGSYRCETLLDSSNYLSNVTTPNLFSPIYSRDVNTTHIPTDIPTTVASRTYPGDKDSVATRANKGYTNLIHDDNKQVYVGLSIGVLLAVFLSSGAVAIVLLYRRRRRSRRKAVKKAIFHLAAMSSRYSIVTEHSLDLSFAFDNSSVLPTFTLDERLQRDRSADIETEFNRCQQCSDLRSADDSFDKSSIGTVSAKTRRELPIQEEASPIELNSGEIVGMNNPLYLSGPTETLKSTRVRNNQSGNEAVRANEDSYVDNPGYEGSLRDAENYADGPGNQDNTHSVGEICAGMDRPCIGHSDTQEAVLDASVPHANNPIGSDIQDSVCPNNTDDIVSSRGSDGLLHSACDVDGSYAGGRYCNITDGLNNTNNLDNPRGGVSLHPNTGDLAYLHGSSYSNNTGMPDSFANTDPRKTRLTECSSFNHEYAKIGDSSYEEIGDRTCVKSNDKRSLTSSHSQILGEQTLLDEILQLTEGLQGISSGLGYGYDILRGEPKSVHDEEQ